MAESGEMATYELAGLEAGQVAWRAEPPPGIVLRPADMASDLPAMAELCRASFIVVADDAVACGEVASLVRHPGLAPPGILVALDGELVVGTVVGRIEVPAAGGGVWRAAVELLVVRPGYRQRGIARALLGRLLAWLTERGVDTVVASTDDPVVGAMLENHGFRANTDVTRTGPV